MMISVEGRGGRPKRWLTSTVPGGARREEKAETASPAETAAVTIDDVPPRNTSVHAIAAASRARVAMSRTPQAAEMFLPEHLAVAPVILAPDNCRIDLPTVEGIKQRSGMIHADFNRKPGVVVVEACKKGRNLRSRHMGGNAKAEATARGGKTRQRPVMRGEKLAGRRQKYRALR
jgi:hypothetical protein